MLQASFERASLSASIGLSHLFSLISGRHDGMIAFVEGIARAKEGKWTKGRGQRARERERED
jgi:hypothetical protein